MSVAINDDYISVDSKAGSFYYGYESQWCSKCDKLNCEDSHDEHYDYQEWCFEANMGGVKQVIPFSKIEGATDSFSMEKNLLLGIAMHLDTLQDIDNAISGSDK